MKKKTYLVWFMINMIVLGISTTIFSVILVWEYPCRNAGLLQDLTCLVSFFGMFWSMMDGKHNYEELTILLGLEK